MADLISLGIKVSNQGITATSNALDKLAESAAKVGTAVDKLPASLQAVDATTKSSAAGVKSLNDTLEKASFGDAKLYKVNQALNTFKANADAARVAADAASKSTVSGFSDAQIYKVNQSLAAYKKSLQDAATAQAKLASDSLNKASFNDTQIYKANQALNAYKASLDAARQAEAAQAQASADNAARIQAVVKASLDRVAAENQATASSRNAQQANAAQAASTQQVIDAQNRAMASQTKLNAEATNANWAKKQQADLAALIGQIDPTVAALERLDQQEAKLNQYKKAGFLDTDSFNEYKAKIQQTRDELGKYTDSQNKAGLSSKALAQANRVLPAQFTDIIVSLSSGQKPLTVLLQQGGQIKDMYGGVGAALKGVGGYILGLLNPITLTAAAIAAVGAAFLAGQGEAEDFNKAIIITGNAAGVTTDQLSDMSKQIGDTVGGQHAAAAALAEVASAGTFTASQLGEVTKAALQLQKTGGQAIGDTVKQFQKLAEDPAKASAELNKQYGYLTASVYDQIKALQDQGKATEAADLAMKTYADSINDRTPQIQQNLGLIQQAWVAIKGAVVGATNAVLDFGRNETGTEAVARLQSQIKLLQNGLNSGGLVGQGAENAKQQIAELTNELIQAQYASAEKQSQAAAEGVKTQFDKRYTAYAEEADKYRSETTKLNQEISAAQKEADDLYAKAIAQGNTKAAAEIRAREKVIVDGLKSRIPKGSAGSISNAENSAQLQDYKDQLAALTKSYDDQQKVLDAKRKGDLIEQHDYYSQSTKLVQDSADAQVKAINDEIAALQARSVSGVAAINNQKQIAQLQADAVKVQADAQQKLTLLRIEEEAETKKTTAAINSYIEALGQQTKARQNEIDAQVQSIGLGDKEFSRLQTLNKITSDAADQQLKLAKARAAGQIDQNTYDQETKALQDAVDARVKAEQDGFEKIDAAQADWTNGAKKAFQDFADEAANTAESTRKIFSDAFDGLSDVITDFITTGKADFKGFLDQLVREIVASQVKQALANQFSGLFGSSGTASAGGGGSYGSIADLFSSGSFSYFKDGGAFQNGKLQKFANGGVVNTPTFFGFGNGSMGVAGEAGDEGILPLRRGPNGKLGVESHGSSGGGRNYSLNQTFVVAGNPDKKTRMQLASENGRQITTAVRRTA